MNNMFLKLPPYKLLQSFITTRFRNFQDRESLETFQQRKLQKHLAWVKENSQYYKAIDIDVFESIPLMDRELFMQYFDDLNTIGLAKTEAFKLALKAEESREFESRLKGVTVGLSSGTSGNRGLFLASDAERYDWAGTILAKLLPEVISQRQRVALFLRSNSNLYTSVRSNRIAFKYLDLDSDIYAQITELNHFQPTVLVSPPSRLRLIAEHSELLNFQPRKVFAGAELLEEIDKAFIEDVFDVKVRQIYQATEGFIAVACEQGNLHFNEDVFYIEKEYIDKATGRFVPILTDFRRTSQPVIRYRLNDLLRDVECSCASVHQALRVEGREDDVFKFVNTSGHQELVFPDELRDCAANLLPHGLEHFEIQQTSPHELNVKLDPMDQSLKEKMEQALTHLFQKKSIDLPELVFGVYDFKSSSTKLRRIIVTKH